MTGILLMMLYATLLSIGMSWALTVRYRIRIDHQRIELHNLNRRLNRLRRCARDNVATILRLRKEIRRLTPKRDKRGRFA